MIQTLQSKFQTEFERRVKFLIRDKIASLVNEVEEEEEEEIKKKPRKRKLRESSTVNLSRQREKKEELGEDLFERIRRCVRR